MGHTHVTPVSWNVCGEGDALSWDDYRLDVKARSLSKGGQELPVQRGVMDCIGYLAQHRDRVVEYDELIQSLWGRDNVSNHQLTQVVAMARRILGDTGHAQTVIRTMSGVGYRWVMPLSESVPGQLPDPPQVNPPAASQPVENQPVENQPVENQSVENQSVENQPVENQPAASQSAENQPAENQPAENPPDPTPPQVVLPLAPLSAVVMPAPGLPPTSPASHMARAAQTMPGGFSSRLSGPGIAAFALLALLLLVDAGRHASDSAASRAEAPLADRLVRHPDPLDAIHNAMRMGLHDAVLEALSKLPVPLADSPDARMLGIQLDIERGRFDSADRRLALELERARSGNDRVWEARLLVLRSERHIKASSHGAECIRPAQSALSLLAAAGSSAPAHTIGRALSARGVGHLKEGQLALAREDLVRAQDILQSTGDEWSIAENRRQLATVWLAMGRMNDALDALVTAADKFQRLGDPVGEMGTRNMATRIQIEQLRWDEALAGTQRTLEVARMVPATRRNIGALQLRGVVLTATGQLRQARSLLEEVHGIETRRYTPVFLAAHMLAADRPREAFRFAEAAFALHQSGDDHRNLVLESKEGAMLLWMTAAQRIAESGAPHADAIARTAGGAAESAVQYRPHRACALAVVAWRIGRGRGRAACGRRAAACARLAVRHAVCERGPGRAAAAAWRCRGRASGPDRNVGL